MYVEVLKQKLKMISESVPKNQWRHFNKRTIENYIDSLELIKGSINRADTISILTNYLNDVELNFEPNVDYSLSLYDKYLKHIQPFYRELGFVLVPGFVAIWAIIPVIIIIAF